MIVGSEDRPGLSFNPMLMGECTRRWPHDRTQMRHTSTLTGLLRIWDVQSGHCLKVR